MNECSRRDVLRSTVCMGSLLATGGVVQSALGSKLPKTKPLVVDAHLHCFAGGNDQRFPYHARAPYRPQAAATPQMLLQLMEGAGVDFAVVVHPEPYQDDHRYLDYCLEVGQGKLKGVCLFFADRPESLERLPGFLRRNEDKIVALRLHAYAPKRLPPFGSPALKRFWSIAGDHNVAVQMHFEPRYADQLGPYLRDFPKTRVIIDHLGRPMQGTPAEHEVVMRWAQRENTYIKLSSLPDQNKYPHRDVKPIVRRLAKEFGAERMIYGGGFNSSATAASYRAYRERAKALIAHLPPDSQAQVLGGNAAKLFGFA